MLHFMFQLAADEVGIKFQLIISEDMQILWSSEIYENYKSNFKTEVTSNTRFINYTYRAQNKIFLAIFIGARIFKYLRNLDNDETKIVHGQCEEILMSDPRCSYDTRQIKAAKLGFRKQRIKN